MEQIENETTILQTQGILSIRRLLSTESRFKNDSLFYQIFVEYFDTEDNVLDLSFLDEFSYTEINEYIKEPTNNNITKYIKDKILNTITNICHCEVVIFNDYRDLVDWGKTEKASKHVSNYYSFENYESEGNKKIIDCLDDDGTD